jgi:hypothetical protein
VHVRLKQLVNHAQSFRLLALKEYQI